MNACTWSIDTVTLTGENQSIWRKTTAKLFTTNPMPDLTWASAAYGTASNVRLILRGNSSNIKKVFYIQNNSWCSKDSFL